MQMLTVAGLAMAVVWLAGVAPRAQSQVPSPAGRPNVVLIITDDVGYGDIGSYGAPDIKTPNIDGLARGGVRLTDFYANATLCSPTRAGLVTGRYQQRFAIEAALGGVSTAEEQGLPASGRSLPQLLKTSGYATALLGKWHLGYKPEFSPNAHGYDYFFGFKSGYIDYYQHTDGAGLPDLFENAAPVQQAGYMTDLITAKTVRFIEQNAGKPFFAEVAYNAGHWPYQVPDKPSVAIGNGRHLMPHDATSTRGDYVAMMERADQGVGEILRTLDRLNLARNTIVIFTNDNGGEWLSRNAPLFNRKWTLWEGGIRVPAIVRWPGRIPAGRVSPQVGITMDFTVSILAAAGAAVPPDARLEGMDIFPILEGRAPILERTLFWRTAAGNHNQKAVRRGDYKLLIDANHEFVFDVRRDLGERTDLAAERQELARTLQQQLAAWEADVDAEARANGTASFNAGRGVRAGGRGGPGRGQ
ncbi:MAG TPA: sulfatase-like hydrolase/transferase [Mycobacterium sp.]|nr:sulfatase-like hydrolase/transferase [Mycobacterium sp.]